MRHRRAVRLSWLIFCVATIAITVTVMTTAQSPSKITSGKIGPGALYEIAMPALVPWNGELVVYAHGIVDPAQPVALPAVASLRDFLTSQGFAVIYSSFSQNGYAVKDGVQRTHQLRGIFTSKVGPPARVYLAGHSLGGLIALMLAERFPDQYDGALPMCGVVGGSPAEIKYIGDARVLFDYFFPHVIPGTAFDIPPGVDFTPGGPTFNAVLGALQAGFVAPGQPTLQFGSYAKLPFASAGELVQAGMGVAGFSVIFTNNVLDLTNGHLPYDNSQTVYSGIGDDAAVNAGVERYTADPSAVNYIAHYYTPTGNLRIPVLTLHTTRDPLVPVFHEDLYAQAAAAAGTSQLLAQRRVNRFGHCTFTDAETATAFGDLVAWVRYGVKPQN